METKFIATQILWSLIERITQKSLSSVTTLILAAILSPSNFGLIAVVLTIVTITNCIIDAGIHQAIIKSDCTRKQLDAGFAINFFLGLCALAVLYNLAPTIAHIYDNEHLTEAIRIASVGSIIYAVQPTCFAILAKQMKFKVILKISLPATLIGALSAIWFSLSGFESHSLIYQYLISTFISSFLGLLATKWKPSLQISSKTLFDLISSSKGLFLSNLTETTYQNIYILTISKIATAHLTGCYFLANNIKNILLAQLINAIQSVYFSANVMHSNDKSKFKNSTKEALIFTNFWGTPAIISTLYLSDIYFKIFFNEHWASASLYLQIILLGSLFFPAHIANINVLRIKGSAFQLLTTEALKKSLAITLLILTYSYGILAVLWGYALASLLALFINAMYSKEIIDYGIKEQILDTYKPLIISVTCLVSIYILNKTTNLPDLFCLLLSISTYLASYFSLSFFFNKVQQDQFIHILRTIVSK